MRIEAVGDLPEGVGDLPAPREPARTRSGPRWFSTTPPGPVLQLPEQRVTRSGPRWFASTRTGPALQMAEGMRSVTVGSSSDAVTPHRRRVIELCAKIGDCGGLRNDAERRIYADALTREVLGSAPPPKRRTVRMSRSEAAKRGLLTSDGRPNYSAWATGVTVVP